MQSVYLKFKVTFRNQLRHRDCEADLSWKL